MESGEIESDGLGPALLVARPEAREHGVIGLPGLVVLVHGLAGERVGQAGRVVDGAVLGLLQELARAVAQELVEADLKGGKKGT